CAGCAPVSLGRTMFRLRKRRAVILGSVLLLSLAGVSVVLASPASAASVTASCVKTSEWSSGFEGKGTVTNGTGAAIPEWKVEFDLPAGTSISSSWDAVRTSSGNHHTFVNTSWNGTVPAGGSVSFGFIGAGTGAISNCKVNGGNCDGSGGGGDTQ